MTDHQRRIAELLRSERADAFAPFFADRVMRRLSGMGPTSELVRADSMYEALRWVFVRAAIATLVLIVAVSLLNAAEFGFATNGNWVDALLGLPSDALADMLTYDLI